MPKNAALRKITQNGMDQGNLVRFIALTAAYINASKTNSVALGATLDALCEKLDVDHALIVTQCTDLGLAVDGICAKLDADAGITDTDYEAIHGLSGSGADVPAALSASDYNAVLGLAGSDGDATPAALATDEPTESFDVTKNEVVVLSPA